MNKPTQNIAQKMTSIIKNNLQQFKAIEDLAAKKFNVDKYPEAERKKILQLLNELIGIRVINNIKAKLSPSGKKDFEKYLEQADGQKIRTLIQPKIGDFKKFLKQIADDVQREFKEEQNLIGRIKN
jgi:hypothetical protein